MKYSISDAARIVGVTRKTFYNHIDKKGITVEKDNDGNPLIDASELIRIYGNDLKFDAAGNTTVTGQGTQTETPTPAPDQTHEVELLKLRIQHLEEQVEHFKDLYEQERDDRRAGTLLITAEREKQTKWEESFVELKQQVVTQQDAKAELDRFKKVAKRKVAHLQSELDQERGKSLIRKLLG